MDCLSKFNHFFIAPPLTSLHNHSFSKEKNVAFLHWAVSSFRTEFSPPCSIIPLFQRVPKGQSVLPLRNSYSSKCLLPTQKCIRKSRARQLFPGKLLCFELYDSKTPTTVEWSNDKPSEIRHKGSSLPTLQCGRH